MSGFQENEVGRETGWINMKILELVITTCSEPSPEWLAEFGEKIAGSEKDKKLIAEAVGLSTYMVNKAIIQVYSKTVSMF